MEASVNWFGNVLVALGPCAALASSGAVSAQVEPSRVPSAPLGGDRESPARITLEGFVLAPDGSPAEGAVVVSSAGGKALTDAGGSYRFEVEVPLEATSVQVTASSGAGGNLVASASIGLSGISRSIRMDPLALSLGSACSTGWVPTFGGLPGVNGNIEAVAVYDDGDGPALFVGGTFTVAGGGAAANNIAKWDGTSWASLGSGTSDTVRALTVYDDGGGPALFVGGDFTSAGGVTANRIAKWDGSSWAALGSGMSSSVNALAVHDEGGGPALYAGGYFLNAGGVTANRIAKWDGSSWAALGSGMTSAVNALAIHDDGGGPALYAAGVSVAKWNGTSWAALGSGMNDQIRALTSHDDGGGPALYAGGSFTIPANRVAKWNGSSWSTFGSGINGSVYSLAVFDDGGGPALHAGGQFIVVVLGSVTADRVAKWNGSSWAALGSGIPTQTVYAMTVHDDGPGQVLYVGGAFSIAGGVGANGIAKWDGASWTAFGDGLNDSVNALAVYDDGGGQALYAGGGLTNAGGVTVNRIAKWNGTNWAPLGSGISADVKTLTVYDDGGGAALYAGGGFTTAGGVTVNGIAKWNGTSWAALGVGMNTGNVRALKVYDDGGGPALYAGGGFTSAGGVSANRIAKWNGTSWAPLGSGLNGAVAALAVYDDGGGPALYAGGGFSTAGGVSANRIAKWNGTNWAPLGSGISEITGTVLALTAHDDGGGPALYAGGLGFTSAGGVAAINIAKWDGASWAALGSGMSGGGVNALAVHDDGTGPALYAGGAFTSAGGVAVNKIARWDGTGWAAVGSGMNNSVLALAVHDDGGGPALYAGGFFARAFDSDDSFLAKLGCVLDTTPPVLSCPSSIIVLDGFLDGPGEVVTFTVTATDELDPSPFVVCVPPSGSTFPSGTTLVDCTATDDSGNQSTCQFPVTVAPKIRQR